MIRKFLATFLATCGWVGLVPKGSGTFGAVIGLFIIMLLPPQSVVFTSVTIITLALAVWSADRAEKIFNKHDDQRIIIDETAGMLFTFLFIPVTWMNIFIGFILFRFFDILKPLGIRKLQCLPGGIGIVADDVGAAFAANIALRLISFIFHA